MRKVQSCPPVVSGNYKRWSEAPLDDLEIMINGLSFNPDEMYLSVESDIYGAARVLDLKVPSRTEDGEIEVAQGVTMSYRWGSSDGRAIDYVAVVGAYDVDVLRSLVASLAQVIKVERRRDLQVVCSRRVQREMSSSDSNLSEHE